MSELTDKQALFMQCLSKLLTHGPEICRYRVYKIRFRLGEGYVADSIDKPFEDTPHLKTGTHFTRTGIDLIVDVWDELKQDWIWITGSHQVYYILGTYWKSLNPECRWGGDFMKRDFNHFSIPVSGVA